MTNEELEIRFSRLVKNERKITVEILRLVQEADKRRHFLERGFSTLFDWLTRGHGYSQGAANRRIQSSRILSEVPSAYSGITSGKLNLSTLAQLQSAIRREENRTGNLISKELKNELVQKINGKSSDETDLILAKQFPKAKRKEVLRSIDGEESRLSLNLNKTLLSNLKRIRDLLSHALPNASWSEVVEYLASDFIKRKDPAHKKSDPANHRVKVQCTFRDEKTGRVCTSTYQLEDDHIIPRAIGGSDKPENFRFLCKQHNLYEAERILGPLGLNKRPTQ